MKTFKVLIMGIMFGASIAVAEVPKTCQEMSSMMISKISDYYAAWPATVVGISLPILSVCVPGKPMPPYDFNSAEGGMRFSVRYVDETGLCKEDELMLMYKPGFTNLKIANLAMAHGDCSGRK